MVTTRLRRLLDKGGIVGVLLVGAFLLLRLLWLRKRIAPVVGALSVIALGAIYRVPQQTPMPEQGASEAATPTYTVADLGTLGGKTSSASAINNKGEVAGTADTPNKMRAFVWRDGTMRDLGAFQDTGSQASGVNDKSQIVGESKALPILWENGRLKVLGMLPGAQHSYARDINNGGQVAGTSYDVHSRQARARAVLWQKGGIRNLGLLPGGTYSIALSINNKGQVVGYGHNGQYWGDFVVPRAFLWDEKNGMREIGTLGGGRYYDESFAYAVNDKAQIVGISNRRAFLWQNGKMRDLGVLPGFQRSRANAINNKGQVVGVVTEPDTGPNRGTPFLWHNGRMHDLNRCIPLDSGWELSGAYGINDAGQIVGGGMHHGQARGFLLTPTRR